MSLKVLHVLDHSTPLHSGYTFRTLAILREQHALGWETLHLTTPKHYGSQQDEEVAAGLKFYRTRPADSWLRRAPIVNQAMIVFDTARRLVDVAKTTRPDIIHAHSPALNGLAALRVGKKLGIPVVYEMRASWEDAAVDHGSTTEGSVRYRLSRALETHVLSRADAITTICDGLRKDIASRGISSDKVTLIPNAVDVGEFSVITHADAELKKKLGLGVGPVLGFLGSYYGYEGLDLLIGALPLLTKEHPNLEVVLVGGGPAESALKTQAAQLGVANRVHFVGRVPHEDVMRYYSVIDLLVYARKSMRLTETVTPLKPLEAMAQGRIFIASDVGGHRELVPEPMRDCLFKPGNSDSLANKVKKFLMRRADWPQMAKEGRRLVAETRTWERSVRGYIGVYDSVLAGRVVGARSSKLPSESNPTSTSGGGS